MERLWIEEKLTSINKKKRDLAVALDLPPSRVSELIKGKRRVQSKEITLLSKFLEMDINTTLSLLNMEPATNGYSRKTKTEGITVIGKLLKPKIGYVIWPKEQQYSITLPKQAIYANLQKFALEEIILPFSTMTLHICISCDDMMLVHEVLAANDTDPQIPSLEYDTIFADPPVSNAAIIASYHQS
ncbi:MAG: helix-turn-helix transcriptional regulator [Sneathiella sp.]